MAVYNPQQLGIVAPKEGFKDLGWYSGRQYVGGTLSEPGQIHPSSPQQGAGQTVSAEVNAQSAKAQGVSTQQFSNYLQQQQQQAANIQGQAQAIAGNRPVTPATPGTSGDTAGAGYVAPTTPNLLQSYENLYAGAGINELQAQLSEQEKQFIDAKMKINDNPFLSEVTRVGRLAKLETLYNERTANARKDIETKKADIEMKLNLETKQFDINSQAAQQALNQFNTLLQMGALDNASGEDIANITRSTGLSSQAIFSAVDAKKAKDVDTQVIQFDDGTNEGFVVINSQTGEIINKQTTNPSKPRAGGGTSKSDYIAMLKEDAQEGLTLSQIFAIYSGYLDPDTIYHLYNSSSSYGPDKGSVTNLAKYGVTQPKKDSSEYKAPY